ncbi:hypothetical protein [Streptomyces sp. NPDC004629]|uniref:hypothetical protein n=1 Tax=Streptomyces sp. NPDC004629 TaxID=3364705 RepID=UPI0036C440CA
MTDTARRRAIAAEGGAPAEGFLVRHNAPGADAEVHLGEVWVDLAGQRVKCYLFAFRLAYSGRAVHRISRSPRVAGVLRRPRARPVRTRRLCG